ncbi:DddA-like double-stranded DNA deaminase toxin [Kribbella sp. CA-293567]|uniref:DddA-like double-stranded DNA deaminase toxin n=1 Tax=Kribbella sp. CA-293567 TaxID=3002436 RepID=UPI0022DE39DA|nr:DddA-like double-stranded DNA deaminase toxin [Kribbella sp. CA-293567]WBQ03228.1 hypothetical protein OX958_24985 [Kribbella sp. CA-293567]
MPSDLQLVAQGLVDCLNEVPRLIYALQQRAWICREHAALVVQLSGGRATNAAMQLDEAARRCEEAAHYLSMAPPKAHGWAQQMVDGIRTVGPTGSDTARRPDALGGSPPPAERRPDERSSEPEAKKSGEIARAGDETSPKDEPQTPKLSDDDVGQVFERLPVRKPGDKTRGVWRDSEGTDHDLVSGQHEDDFHAAQRHAEKLGLVRRPHGMTTAADVELKFAMRMRREGIRHAEIIINNRPCEGQLGCDELLDRFLPDDATLIIHGPNNFKRMYPKSLNPE